MSPTGSWSSTPGASSPSIGFSVTASASSYARSRSMTTSSSPAAISDSRRRSPASEHADARARRGGPRPPRHRTPREPLTKRRTQGATPTRPAASNPGWRQGFGRVVDGAALCGQQASTSGISDGLETAVHPELAEKVLDVVPDGRRAHAEPLGRHARVGAGGEQTEHLELARRERARSSGQVVVLHRARALRRNGVAEEMDHERPFSIARRQGERAHVDGHRLAPLGAGGEIEAAEAFFRSRQHLAFRPASVTAFELTALEHFAGVAPNGLSGRISKEPLGCPVPKNDATVRADGEHAVTGLAESLVESAVLELLHTRPPLLLAEATLVRTNQSKPVARAERITKQWVMISKPLHIGEILLGRWEVLSLGLRQY